MKYAQFNPQDTNAITPVTGWYLVKDDSDPDGYVYPSLPAASVLVDVPDVIWNDPARINGGYSVDKSAAPTLVTTPGPTAAQQLQAAQSKKSADMQAACRSQIYQGFISSALGSDYHYPAEDRDQTNLNGCVTQSYWSGNAAGWTISFYCEDANGVWAKRPHTAAQIQQVGNDAINAIQAALNKNDQLQQQIQAATTIDQVNAITW